MVLNILSALVLVRMFTLIFCSKGQLCRGGGKPWAGKALVSPLSVSTAVSSPCRAGRASQSCHPHPGPAEARALQKAECPGVQSRTRPATVTCRQEAWGRGCSATCSSCEPHRTVVLRHTARLSGAGSSFCFCVSREPKNFAKRGKRRSFT